MRTRSLGEEISGFRGSEVGGNLRHGTHVKEVQLCCAPHACVHGLMHLERRWDVGESEHACVAQSTVATAAAASYVAPEVAGGFDVCSYGLI